MVEVTDYGDAASFESAVKGVDTLLLVSFKEHQDRLRQHLTAPQSLSEFLAENPESYAHLIDAKR